MKKKTMYIIGILLAIVILICIVLASYIEKKNSVVNDYKKVTIYIKDATLSASGMTLSVNNASSGLITLSDKYYIERQVGSKWYQVPYQSLSGSKLENSKLEVPANSYGEYSMKVSWIKTYGVLDPGAYRLTKPFTTSSGKIYNLAVTFEIKDS